MNLPHPKPVFLAPIVNKQHATVGEQIEHAVSEQMEQVKREHAQVQLAFRDELAKAHARLAALESRWYERVARWFRRGGR